MRGVCIALFGAAEKGKLAYPYLCKELLDLFHILGSPPEDTRGLRLAMQTILRGGQVWYFRVEEEGFSERHYESGFRYLEKERAKAPIDALFLPGVSDYLLVESAKKVCRKRNCLLVFEEGDLFDYLMG
ncbi:MAG: hypothetical protein AAGI90_05210 [Chlamydiota bacterium]